MIRWLVIAVLITGCAIGCLGQVTALSIRPARTEQSVIIGDPGGYQNYQQMQYYVVCAVSPSPPGSYLTTNCNSNPNILWSSSNTTASTISSTGLATVGTAYGTSSIKAMLNSADVTITAYSCTAQKLCTFTTSTAPTAVQGASYYITGLTGGLATGGPFNLGANQQTITTTAVTSTSFTGTVTNATGAIPSTTGQSGSATIASPSDGFSVLNTLHTTPTNSGHPVVPTLPTGITSLGTWPPTYSGTVFDTTFSLPTGGTTWTPTCTGGVGLVYGGSGSGSLQDALNRFNPGDIILINHNCTWTITSNNPLGIPGRANPSHKWTYIMTDAYASLPPPGPGTGGVNPASRVRISPTNIDGPNMPTLINASTTNADSIFMICGNALLANQPSLGCGGTSTLGSSYIRFVGLHLSQTNAASLRAQLIGILEQATNNTASVDHIIYDRMWLDGGPAFGTAGAAQMQHAVNCNASPCALIDSYCNNIWSKDSDAQCLTEWLSNGPLKINNNWIEAYGEGIEIGGAGNFSNPYLVQDIESINNHSYYNPAYTQYCTGPTGSYIVCKNRWEFKHGNRVLFDHNTLENQISKSQSQALALTARTGSTGSRSVIDNFTITNNYLKLVNGSIAFLAYDNSTPPALTSYTTGGELVGIAVINNVFTACDPNVLSGWCGQQPNGQAYPAYQLEWNNGLQAIDVEHNTIVMDPSVGQSRQSSSNFAADNEGHYGPPTPQVSYMHNLWYRCNVDMRQWAQTNILVNTVGDIGATAGDSGDTTTSLATRIDGNFFSLFTDHVAPWPNMNGPGATCSGGLCGNVVSSSTLYFTNTTATPPDMTLQNSTTIGPRCYDTYPIGVNGVVGEQAPPTNPTIVAGTPPPAAYGEPYSYTFTVIGGTSPYSNWVKSAGTYPVWSGVAFQLGPCTASCNTITATGTPANGDGLGNSVFSLTVQDATPTTSAAQPFTITTNPRLTATPKALPQCITGSTYGTTLSYTGGTSNFAWVTPPPSGSLPPGLTLTAAGGINGTCGAAGTYTFTGQITDAGITNCTGANSPACQSYTIVVNPSLAVTTASLMSATVATSYSSSPDLAATGGVPPYTWSSIGTTVMPLCGVSTLDGLCLTASTGVISGSNPSPATTIAGLQFQVTDSGSTIASSPTLSLIIQPPSNPVIVSLTETNINSPTKIGNPYTLSLASYASGGTPFSSGPHYTWALASGSLPPGIRLINDPTLGWIISGTPTQYGTYNFRLTATDSVGTQGSGPATGNYSLTISSLRGCSINQGALKGASCD